MHKAMHVLLTASGVPHFVQVGHQLVEAYASCTGLPLIRKAIKGRPVNQVRNLLPLKHTLYPK
jgi:hypothetical protein